MKLIRLEIQNVLKLSAVTIEPDGSVTLIGGKNRAGKSSVLAAIEMALGGGNAIPKEPLRRGAKKGYVVLDLGDIVVERRFNRNGTTLNIRNADGTEVKSPQKLLDSFIGRVTFDPGEFASMKPEDQLATLKKIVGLDFSAIDRKRKEAFEKRTLVNRSLKEAEARVKACQSFPDAPEAEVSVAELTTELKRRQFVDKANSDLRDGLAEADEELEQKQAEIDRIQKSLEKAIRESSAMKKSRDSLDEQVAAITDPKTAEIEQQLSTVDEQNRKVRANAARKKEMATLDQHQKDAEKLTGIIEECDEAKQESMSAAKFPIEGLGFDETGVTMNGLPFEQCSSAETIEVSMAIGLALNPKLPLVLIRNGSLIDDEHLEIVRRMAEQHDPPAQVIVERVGGTGCSIVIEDGHLQGDEPPAAEDESSVEDRAGGEIDETEAAELESVEELP